jgi:hypothetical protein
LDGKLGSCDVCRYSPTLGTASATKLAAPGRGSAIRYCARRFAAGRFFAVFFTGFAEAFLLAGVLLTEAFLRAGRFKGRRAAFSTARVIAGVFCSTFARPLPRASAAAAKTTSAAAFAAAPTASLATDLTLSAPLLAASDTASLACVIMPLAMRIP